MTSLERIRAARVSMGGRGKCQNRYRGMNCGYHANYIKEQVIHIHVTTKM